MAMDGLGFEDESNLELKMDRIDKNNLAMTFATTFDSGKDGL